MSNPNLPSPSLRPIGNAVGGPAPSARWLLIAASLVSLALWYVPGAELLLYPIRLFVTFIHEGGHALATVVTGGSVHAVQVNHDTSGLTLSRGGLGFLISMAGYVGTTAFGAGTLLLSRRNGNGRAGLVVLGAVTFLITGLWINPIGPGFFGFACGATIGVALIAAARFLGERAGAFVLSFLSVQLCLNALFDIRTLVLLTTQTSVPNDAVFMARDFGFTPWFWALLWAAASAAILGVALRIYWREGK
jgi:hypothetical protein